MNITIKFLGFRRYKDGIGRLYKSYIMNETCFKFNKCTFDDFLTKNIKEPFGNFFLN